MSYRCEQVPVITGSGSLVACRDGDRVVLLALPNLTVLGEIALASGADADLGFLGDRLLVVARQDQTTTIHIVDPRRLQVTGTIELAGPARLLATTRRHALVAALGGVLAVWLEGERGFQARMPLRGVPTAAGHVGEHRAVVDIGGSIETWDLETRRPLHRVRTERPLHAAFLGGSDARLWLVPAARTSHLEVMPLDSRGVPWRRLVDGPITAAAHAFDVDVVALAGASSAPSLISIAHRESPIVAVPDEPAEALWFGADPPVLITARRGDALRAWTVGVRAGEVTVAEQASSDAGEPARSPAPAPPPRVDDPARAVAPPPSPAPVLSVHDRLKEWRDRLRPSPSTRPPASPAARGVAGAWRDVLVAWARALVERGTAEPPPWDDESSLASAASHLKLAVGPARGLALLYAAHLDRLGRVSRAALARAIGGDTAWDEALGRGALATAGLARWSAAGVGIVAEVAAALDELPPRHARLVGGGDISILALAGPCAVLAAADAEITAAAERASITLGVTIAVIDGHGATPLAVRLLEARVRGAVPMVTAGINGTALDALGPALIVASAVEAEALGVPFLFGHAST